MIPDGPALVEWSVREDSSSPKFKGCRKLTFSLLLVPKEQAISYRPKEVHFVSIHRNLQEGPESQVRDYNALNHL